MSITQRRDTFDLIRIEKEKRKKIEEKFTENSLELKRCKKKKGKKFARQAIIRHTLDIARAIKSHCHDWPHLVTIWGRMTRVNALTA